MIKKIKLTNFMRHEDLEIEFTQGINVLRARNEGGKTTLLNGVAYALFGTNALSAPLAEIVTWGKAEKDLRVELHIGDYLFSRGKSGAEVTVNGNVFVTGQTEVSNFAAELLGVDAKGAMALMFAVQGGLRGVLEEGPKATAGLIENLADLELFDRILEAAQNKLALGSTALFEERLKGLREQQSMLPQAEEPAPLDLSSIEGQIALNKTRVLELEPALNGARDHYTHESEKRAKRVDLIAEIGKLENQITQQGEKREQERVKKFAPDLDTQLEGLLKAQREAERHAEVVEVYKSFEAFRPASVHPLLGSEAHTQNVLDTVEVGLGKMQASIFSKQSELAVAKAGLVLSTACDFCGMDVSQFPAVAEKNTRTRATINVLEEELASIRASMKDVTETKDRLTDALREQRRVSALIFKLGTHLEVDESVTPNAVSWRGEPPGEAQDFKVEIGQVRVQIRERDDTRVKIETLDGVINELHERVKLINAEIQALEVLDDAAFNQISDNYSNLYQQTQTLLDSITALEQERLAKTRTHEDAVASYTRNIEYAKALARDIAKAESDIASVGFNNALVKKIRAARPVVGNKLWNLVLASVSTLFTQIRGVNSVVTREGPRFLVNGKSAATLSGSTKDALGLALRVALTKTFLPSCGLLVLDEANAAMDDDRAQSLLGFVASCGIEQVLFVTHDPVSELFADNLIQLEN